ncbi:MAG: ATPase [Gemmobacter sp.]|uniref:BadF/BadG/BcrA/BcrD ATPase family protein n=1 Tax=Gemmobacter sp. TaxID=1898957 RepID=UPI001A386A70|nr:BadF/BadG/BcrA/BcrD ATPase family protein [Gemmobacter sp.]MBL8560842.1 ATPase [Gemmobacter sp.]
MTVFLGIDGGGTGCRAVASDAAGHVLGRGSAGPANVNTDLAGTRANVLAAAEAALAGADPARVTAVLGLAGANIRSAAEALCRSLPFARTRVVTDAVTAARGALGGEDGIVAAMGTGSVFAVQRGGEMRQFGGRGFLLGDEGSGAVLGRALLARALRAEDGFAEMTPLLRSILAEFGGIEGVIRFATTARPAEFGALAPRLTGSDDAAATAIFGAAVAEVRSILDTLQGPAPLPVTFLGGLGPAYAAQLGSLWTIRPALGSGVEGALAMARALAPAMEA